MKRLIISYGLFVVDDEKKRFTAAAQQIRTYEDEHLPPRVQPL